MKEEVGEAAEGSRGGIRMIKDCGLVRVYPEGLYRGSVPPV